VVPTDYIDGEVSAEPGSEPALPSLRERIESLGLLPPSPTVHAPFAGVPEWDADAEDLAIGPPQDVEPAGLAVRPASELREGPWSLLLATALRSASAAEAPLVEDALLRRSDAALSPQDETRLRPLADQVALLESEYLAASRKYHAAEDEVPSKATWHNPQHLLEAMKVHERRMDRLQRGMRDAHERLVRAVQLLEETRAGGGGKTIVGGARAVGVEVTQSGSGTSRVRVGAR